jgi:hypothetical protein
MLTHQFEAAIAAASPSKLTEINGAIWKALKAGALSEDDAGRLSEAIHARKTLAKATTGPVTGAAPLGRLKSIFPPKRRQRSPDKAASLERRRTIAASGPLPPALAARYTTGQLAVLGVVGDEIAARGECLLTVGEIAARAGVSHRLAQTAVRLAEADGLLVVLERRRKGDVNLSNVVRILSREWKAWLARRGGRGCRSSRPTDSKALPVGRQAEPLSPTRQPESRFERERQRWRHNEKAPR